MRLAARSGLDVAPVAIGTAGPYRFLQVERYDRKPLGKNWLRFFHDAGLGPAVAAKRLKAFAANVSKNVRAMDESSAGWELISPIVLANCARVISLDIR